jgi:predicted site-specific integrase-resolvase
VGDGSYLIAAAEAAEIAGVSEAAIRQWATRGKIQRFPGRRRCEPTLYARPEIEAEAEKRAGRMAMAA